MTWCSHFGQDPELCFEYRPLVLVGIAISKCTWFKQPSYVAIIILFRWEMLPGAPAPRLETGLADNLAHRHSSMHLQQRRGQRGPRHCSELPLSARVAQACCLEQELLAGPVQRGSSSHVIRHETGGQGVGR